MTSTRLLLFFIIALYLIFFCFQTFHIQFSRQDDPHESELERTDEFSDSSAAASNKNIHTAQDATETNNSPSLHTSSSSPEDLFFEKQRAIMPQLQEACQYEALKRQTERHTGHRLTSRKKPIKIFDGFTFNNEFDMLEVRLREMAPIVDYFVLVEAAVSFQNKPKELHFKNKIESGWDVYEEFKHQIIHVIVESRPEHFEYWENEVHFRDAIAKEGLQQVAMQREETQPHDNDIIIVSDLDEIIHPNVVAMWKYLEGWKQEIFAIQFRWTYYNYLWENLGQWKKCIGATWRELKKHDLQSNRIRFNCLDQQSTPAVMEIVSRDRYCWAGWHCSSCMPYSMFRSKVSSFSHTEYMAHFERNEKHLRRFVKEGIWYQSGKREGRKTELETLSETAVPSWLKGDVGSKKYAYLISLNAV